MKQAAPMPDDYGNGYGQKSAAPMPDYGNTGYDTPPAYSSSQSPQSSVPLGIVAVNCKQCGTHFGMPEGAQSVSCPGCQAVHDPSGNIVINVTNNIHHHYAGQQGGAVAVAEGHSANNVPGFPVGPNNYNPNVPYPVPVEIAKGPLAGYAPDQEGGLGHCCDCGDFKGDKCCANSYFFFTLCRQARTYTDGVCDSTVGHWCFYVWCYPFHVICDIIMFLFSPIIFFGHLHLVRCHVPLLLLRAQGWSFGNCLLCDIKKLDTQRVPYVFCLLLQWMLTQWRSVELWLFLVPHAYQLVSPLK